MRLVFEIMTKKPSEKNKAWEKERRDRLNKAFEQLAKLLPQYDPTVSWSKNEIIQKSIVYIEELHLKHESILKEQDPESLREYNDLLDTLKFLKSRNGQLADLLNKAKITIPPAKFPKFLADNPKFGDEKKLLEITTRPVGRPKKYTNEISAERLNSLAELQDTKNKPEAVQVPNVNQKSQLKTGPAAIVPAGVLSTGAIISNGVLMPLIPCQPSPLLPITTASTVPSLVSLANGATYRKCKIFSIQTLPRLARLPRAKDEKVNILPRPVLKLHVRRNDGKVPIPFLKPKVVAIKRKRRRRRKLKQTTAVKKASKRKQQTDKGTAVNEKVRKLSGSAEDASIVKSPCPIPLSNADLPDDYFSTLQIPENNSNPSSVSPTAAFLLSFPVVSTTGVGGKNTDGADETAILSDEQQTKGNVNDGLENLNNFFSTKEYYKYCGQTNEGSVNGKELEVKQSVVEVSAATSAVTSANTELQSVTTTTYNSVPGAGNEITNLTTSTSMPVRLIQAESCKAPTSNSRPVFLVAESTIPRSVVTTVASETFTVNSFVPKASDATISRLCMSSNATLVQNNSLPQSGKYSHSTNNFPTCNSNETKFSFGAGGHEEPSTKAQAQSKVNGQSSMIFSNSNTIAANPAPYSSHINFPISQSSNFSVSNIFSSSNSTAAISQETGAATYRNTTTKAVVSTLPSSIPNPSQLIPNMTLPEATNFTANNSYVSSTSSKALTHHIYPIVACPNITPKLDSTTITFTTISNSIPTPSPFPSHVPLQSASPAFLPSSSSACILTNSIKATKPMQFTDYSSTFMPVVSVSTSSRSYAPLPLAKSSAKASTQSATLSTNELNSVRTSSFPISYNFGPCIDSASVAKGTTKPLPPLMSTMASTSVGLLSTTSFTPSTSSLVTQSYIDPVLPTICGPKFSSAVTSTTNYYFPLQTPAVTSSFTFNLTSTASTTTATTAATSFLNYPSVKPSIPWIPSTTTVDYKPSFTFSLTPSSTTYTTKSHTMNSSGPVKSFATLPAVKPSESIAKTTFDPFNSVKTLNPFSEPVVIPNSYSSTNFTFSLARPKTTVTVATEFTKPLPSCSTVDPKYQTSYHPYNFDNYANVYPKETTNFTFALTKPTQSFSSSFSIDSTLAVTSSYSSQSQPNAVSNSSDFHKNRNNKSSHFLNNQKATMIKDPSVNYYSPEHSKLPKAAQKSHVNWMTSAEVLQPMDIGQQSSCYYPSHITPALDFNNKKIDPNSASHGLAEDNHFSSWSPSKILDTSHLMPSTTLSNYYSDLNSLPPVGYDNSKIYPKPYGVDKLDKPYKAAPNSSNQGNFFSVSQLVDQSAPNSKSCEGYNKKLVSQKSKDFRKTALCNADPIQNNYAGPKPATLNNYSAEALISKKEKHRNYPPPLQHHHNSDYYTPPHHDPASNSYMHQDTENLNNYNANYFYNYMPPNQNYAQETDYLGAYSGNMQYSKMNNAPAPKSSLSTNIKSEKRILPPPPAAAAPSNLMPYESNYLPVPPIGAPPPVVDAYEPHHYSHSNNFQHGGWSATKSSLPTYHHGQGMLPAGDDVNLPNNNQAGSSNLTNFNLSTICPEINDKVEQSNW